MLFPLAMFRGRLRFAGMLVASYADSSVTLRQACFSEDRVWTLDQYRW
jgi:hypothetical protein